MTTRSNMRHASIRAAACAFAVALGWATGAEAQGRSAVEEIERYRQALGDGILSL